MTAMTTAAAGEQVQAAYCEICLSEPREALVENPQGNKPRSPRIRLS
jgi:hypothetical protein